MTREAPKCTGRRLHAALVGPISIALGTLVAACGPSEEPTRSPPPPWMAGPDAGVPSDDDAMPGEATPDAGIAATCAGMREGATFSDAQTIEIAIAASTDDAHGSPLANSANELQLGLIDGVHQTVGLRFLDLAVPRCARIDAAAITGTSSSDYDTAIELAIRGELSASPADFSTRDPAEVSDLTGAEVIWSLTGNVFWSYMDRIQSPDLSEVVQEIVDLEGWAPGDDLALLLRSQNVGSENDHRRLHAWDRTFTNENKENVVKLQVTYSVPE